MVQYPQVLNSSEISGLRNKHKCPIAMIFKLFTHIPQYLHFTLQPSNIYMCILTYKGKSLYIERNNIISVGGGALIFFIASFFYKCLHDPQID